MARRNEIAEAIKAVDEQPKAPPPIQLTAAEIQCLFVALHRRDGEQWVPLPLPIWGARDQWPIVAATNVSAQTKILSAFEATQKKP